MKLHATLLAVVSSLSVSTVFAGGEAPVGPLRVGELTSAWLESPHPYLGGDSVRPSAVTLVHPGATYIKVHFARLDLGPNDTVVVRDPLGRRAHRYRGTGLVDTLPGFWSLSVLGDTAIVEIESSSGAGGWGFAVDGYEHGFVPVAPESICSVDDKQDAVCYQTSHPLYWEKAQSVGRVRHCGGLCTGSLISCDGHFLTNEHCKGTCGVTNLEIDFDYHRPDCGSGMPVENVFQGATDVQTDVTLDYWISTLAGDPVATYGFLQLDPRPLDQDEEIYIPQHPGGVPKQLGIESDSNAGGVCRIDEPNQDGRGADTDTGYLCDTAGGSSGSPVLSPLSHRVIALHHFGGCLNGGIRIENIGPDVEAVLPGCSFCDGTVVAPGAPTVTATGPNEITVDWSPVAGAASYRVMRAQGDCNASQSRVAEVPGPPWVDDSVSGGLDYSYSIVSIDAERCTSSRSACETQTATGDCILPPAFGGVTEARSGLSSSCQIELAWDDGVGTCSNDLVYNIYRSTAPNFTPSVATLHERCVTASPWFDTLVAGGVRYYYKVRVEDRGAVGSGPCVGGVEEDNFIELPAEAALDTPLSELNDGAEAAAVLVLEAPWAVSTADARTGSASYLAPAADDWLCAALRTEPLIVTAGSVLSYATRVEALESAGGFAADGGTVELSSDDGATWTQLSPTPDYSHEFFAGNSVKGCNQVDSNRTYSGTLDWTDATVDLSPWAGQLVMIRFLLGTDGADLLSDSVAWWIDDVRVTNVAAEACGDQPPGEVSGLGAEHRLLLAKGPAGAVLATFEERPEALGYNLYEGTLGQFFDHGDSPFACGVAVTPAAPGQLSATFVPGPGLHYYLVTAWNGDSINGAEGSVGVGRPSAENTCPPLNNY